MDAPKLNEISTNKSLNVFLSYKIQAKPWKP